MLRSHALTLLNAKIVTCDKCAELSEYRMVNNYRYVFGEGSPTARVMFVGEAPGENEAKTGVPFCGKAGNLLTNIIKAAGWTREEVFICNTVKCRPPGNRDPEPEETANCRQFLDMQIKVVDPAWIVCLGRVAAINVLGLDPDTTIGSLRGVVHDLAGRKVVCTYHPSFLQRADTPKKLQEAKRAVWDDLQPVISALRS